MTIGLSREQGRALATHTSTRVLGGKITVDRARDTLRFLEREGLWDEASALRSAVEMRVGLLRVSGRSDTCQVQRTVVQ